MNDADKKLLELAEKATPRPWRSELADIDDEDEDGNPIQYGPAGVTPIFTIDCGEYHGLSNADASYIVAAANAVPRLIAENEALLKRIRVMRHGINIARAATAMGEDNTDRLLAILTADDTAAKDQPDPPPADSLLRRLVARLDETGGLLLEFGAGTDNPRLTSCLDDNHRTLVEARARLMPRRWSFAEFAAFYIAVKLHPIPDDARVRAVRFSERGLPE